MKIEMDAQAGKTIRFVIECAAWVAIVFFVARCAMGPEPVAAQESPEALYVRCVPEHPIFAIPVWQRCSIQVRDRKQCLMLVEAHDAKRNVSTEAMCVEIGRWS